MVEPAEFSQDFYQFDVDIGGATASFNANSKANDDRYSDQCFGAISLGQHFETIQQIKRFMSNISKKEGVTVHFNKQKKPGKYYYYTGRFVCAYDEIE